MKHRHSIWHGSDGSYVIYQRFAVGLWWPVASWLIPGTQKPEPDWDALRTKVMERFPKTLAYLASH